MKHREQEHTSGPFCVLKNRATHNRDIGPITFVNVDLMKLISFILIQRAEYGKVALPFANGGRGRLICLQVVSSACSRRGQKLRARLHLAVPASHPGLLWFRRAFLSRTIFCSIFPPFRSNGIPGAGGKKGETMASGNANRRCYYAPFLELRIPRPRCLRLGIFRFFYCSFYVFFVVPLLCCFVNLKRYYVPQCGRWMLR